MRWLWPRTRHAPAVSGDEPDADEYARGVIERLEQELSGPDDRELAARWNEWIANGCKGSTPRRPWAPPEARSAVAWPDTGGIESGHEEQQGPPPLPDPYPLSGSACYRCPPRGTDDPRCCQHGNHAFIQRLREQGRP